MPQLSRAFGSLPATLLALAAFTAGCDGGEGGLGPVCQDIARPAVVVTVLDATTGQADATGARGIVVEGAYTDSLRPARTLPFGRTVSLSAATERPGTYAVRVERPGYRTMERSGIVAPRGACGVVTAEVAFWLFPES